MITYVYSFRDTVFWPSPNLVRPGRQQAYPGLGHHPSTPGGPVSVSPQASCRSRQPTKSPNPSPTLILSLPHLPPVTLRPPAAASSSCSPAPSGHSLPHRPPPHPTPSLTICIPISDARGRPAARKMRRPPRLHLPPSLVCPELPVAGGAWGNSWLLRKLERNSGRSSNTAGGDIKEGRRRGW